MNDAERINRATRANAAWDEFFEPMLAELKAEYTSRIVDVANKELSPAPRSDKITALSYALRIVDALESGMLATIRDGDMAHRDVLRADDIESMTKPQSRLRRIIPG